MRCGSLSGTGLKGHQHLADNGHGTDRNQDVADDAGYGRGDFHRRLVGLDFEDNLSFYNLLAGGNRDGQYLRLVHAFAEIRQSK